MYIKTCKYDYLDILFKNPRLNDPVDLSLKDSRFPPSIKFATRRTILSVVWKKQILFLFDTQSNFNEY